MFKHAILFAAVVGLVFVLASAAQAAPVSILNGSFEEGSTSITTTIAGVQPVGYTTYDLVEYADIARDGRFDDSLATPPNTGGNVNQPTGNNGRPRNWTYTGSIIQDNIATEARWAGVWNSWQGGPTDGRTVIILDNRSGEVGTDLSAWIMQKQTLSLNVGQLKALGTRLEMHFDARYNEASETAAGFDADGDDFIKVYFEVAGVQDVAGTWTTLFDATRKIHTFAEINGSVAGTYYAPITATKANPARNPAGTVGSQNMETFLATLDLSLYTDNAAAVTMVVYNSRFKDGTVNSATNRAYMDNVRVDVVPEPATLALLGLGGLGLILGRKRK